MVPLYLAECLAPASRGKGTGIFQWLLTLGILTAALIGIYYSYRVGSVSHGADAAALFRFKDQAWRRIFWVSLPPGILFVIGTTFVAESPRWLFRRGRLESARMALLRSRSPERAAVELREMQETAQATTAPSNNVRSSGSLFQRRYVLPFLLACLILFCNTATGINSVIAYNTGILLQSGLSDLQAHWGYVLFTAFNFLLTIGGMTLVDRRGRRFLLMLGTGGIIASMLGVGLLFHQVEGSTVDCRSAVQALVGSQGELTMRFSQAEVGQLLAKSGYAAANIPSGHASLSVIYSYGGFTGTTTAVRSDDPSAAPVHITRLGSVPASAVEAFFKNPFANVRAAQAAPLRIDRALIGRIPDARHGWLVAAALYAFVAFYAVGPGVCGWLALSELMPTRIRSSGMSIALVINQLVSTTLAVIFLPVVSKYGYSTMFFVFAGFALLYFVSAALFLPETKNKTLEEIESYFEQAGLRNTQKTTS